MSDDQAKTPPTPEPTRPSSASTAPARRRYPPWMDGTILDGNDVLPYGPDPDSSPSPGAGSLGLIFGYGR